MMPHNDLQQSNVQKKTKKKRPKPKTTTSHHTTAPPTTPPSKPSRLQRFLTNLRGAGRARQQKKLERAAAAETARRLAIPASGAEASAQKAAAEAARRYVVEQSGRVQRTPDAAVHGRIAKALGRGEISERVWLAWATEFPECLVDGKEEVVEEEAEGEEESRGKAGSGLVLRAFAWRECGFEEWTFEAGMRGSRSPEVAVGPRGEVVDVDYVVPDLDGLKRRGFVCRVASALRRYVKAARTWCLKWRGRTVG